jgi:hypothetical protein
VTRTALDLIYAFNGSKVHWVGGETVKSVGRHSQYLSLANTVGSITHQLGFRLAAVDLQEFCRQWFLFWVKM